MTPLVLSGALLVTVSAALGALAFVRMARRRVVVEVRGDSMMPTLQDGERLVARRYTGGPIAVGDIVIFARPPLRFEFMVSENQGAGLAQWWVKRVAAGPGDPVPASVSAAAPGLDRVPPGMLVVLGDSFGLDSRAFGLLRTDLILGVARRPGPGARDKFGASPSSGLASMNRA